MCVCVGVVWLSVDGSVCGCVCYAWVAVRVAVRVAVCGCACGCVWSVAVYGCGCGCGCAHPRCCNNICTWQPNIQIASQHHSQRRVTRLLLHQSFGHSLRKAEHFLQLLLLGFNGSASECSLHVCVQDQQSLSG